MRDYVRALRALWRCWETGGKLDYRGEHYQLTLMTPDFSPEPTGLPMVPITIAAVGEAMLRVAGEVCDGVRLHPLCSRRYLEEVALPRIAEGMERSGRCQANFDVFGGGFVVTGPDEKTVSEGVEWARKRIAIYSSTRTYAPILALHGLEEIGAKLHAMSVAGRWNDMPAEITDDVVRIFAACGTYDEIAAAIEARYGGLGIPEPYPSWGCMLSESAAEYVRVAPWLVIFPGIAISLAVFGTNLFGDALRDILDPRQRG